MSTEVFKSGGKIVLNKDNAVHILDEDEAVEMALAVLALAQAGGLPSALTTMLDGTMHEEHQAWIEMCKRISQAAHEGRSTDINDPAWNPAVDQIKYWGETLHRLRLANPEHDEKAYAEAHELATNGR